MHLSDNEFFEEYKRLDKLCSEMYSCQNGVSEYISEMERKAYQGQRFVSGWNSDLNMLKHVRWVRNQIAHEAGTYQISKLADLQFVRDFRKRIFSGADSLALLRKATEAEAERRRQLKKQAAAPVKATAHTPGKKRSGKWAAILIGAIVLAAVILLFFNR